MENMNTIFAIKLAAVTLAPLAILAATLAIETIAHKRQFNKFVKTFRG